MLFDKKNEKYILPSIPIYLTLLGFVYLYYYYHGFKIQLQHYFLFEDYLTSSVDVLYSIGLFQVIILAGIAITYYNYSERKSFKFKRSIWSHIWLTFMSSLPLIMIIYLKPQYRFIGGSYLVIFITTITIYEFVILRRPQAITGQYSKLCIFTTVIYFSFFFLTLAHSIYDSNTIKTSTKYDPIDIIVYNKENNSYDNVSNICLIGMNSKYIFLHEALRKHTIIIPVANVAKIIYK